jgi:cytochrome c biogenesis protein CcmG/thiol:disulfide interchange protein DsbE
MNKLSPITCPNCGSSDLTTISDTSYQCKSCNTVFSKEIQSHPKWGRLIAWTGLLLLLVIVGFGLARTQQGPVGVGQKAPDFTLTTFDGQQISLRSLQGKVIVINFWASWCKPCESEAADLESAWQFYQSRPDIIFLGADYVDTEPEAKAYLQKFNITYPNGPDLGTRISQAFRILGVPETYFIDRNGKLAYKQIGPFASLEDIKAIIDPLMGY